jgi:hypothetical protein
MTEQNNLPHRDVDREREHVRSLLQRVKQEAREGAMELGLPEQAGYDVLAVVHGQALMGEREIFSTEISLVSSANATASQHPYSLIGCTREEIGQLLDGSDPQDRPPARLVGVYAYNGNHSRVIIDQPPDQMSLTMLAERCAQEINKYRQNEPNDERYALEIFRRAVVLRDHEAWATLQCLFHENVRFWFSYHACRDAALRYESEEDYVDHAFQRFWQAVNDQALTFTSLAGALRYLKLCLHCAIMDTLRLYAHPRQASLPEQERSDGPLVEDRYDESELWETISSLMVNERERRVAYLHFHCNLKPRDIMRYCPGEFSGEEEIYRIKRNIMERIMRNVDRVRWRLL